MHCASGIFVFLGACLISFTPRCNGGNILVFPMDGSHWVNMKILLEELHTRGHSITMIRPSNGCYISEKSPLYTSLAFKVSEGFEEIFEAYLQEQMTVGHFELCTAPHLRHLVTHYLSPLLCYFFRHRERGPQHLLSSNSPRTSFL